MRRASGCEVADTSNSEAKNLAETGQEPLDNAQKRALQTSYLAVVQAHCKLFAESPQCTAGASIRKQQLSHHPSRHECLCPVGFLGLEATWPQEQARTCLALQGLPQLERTTGLATTTTLGPRETPWVSSHAYQEPRTVQFSPDRIEEKVKMVLVEDAWHSTNKQDMHVGQASKLHL